MCICYMHFLICADYKSSNSAASTDLGATNTSSTQQKASTSRENGLFFYLICRSILHSI